MSWFIECAGSKLDVDSVLDKDTCMPEAVKQVARSMVSSMDLDANAPYSSALVYVRSQGHIDLKTGGNCELVVKAVINRILPPAPVVV